MLLLFFWGCSSSSQKKDNGDVENAGVSAETGEVNGPENGDVEKNMFTGSFKLRLSSYKGTLIIKKKSGSYYGYMVFKDWGGGRPHELKKISIDINERKIFFIRSIRTPEEAKKFNAGRYFVQKYYGEFTVDGKRIKGYYIDSGAESSWQAER